MGCQRVRATRLSCQPCLPSQGAQCPGKLCVVVLHGGRGLFEHIQQMYILDEGCNYFKIFEYKYLLPIYRTKIVVMCL